VERHRPRPKRLSVRQTAILEYHDGRRTVVFGKPKTNSGRRVVALDAGTIAVLREHRIQQLEERLAAGEDWKDHDLVMPKRDGQPFDPEYFSREFRSRLKRYGVPDIRLHDLRHTHATLALQAESIPRSCRNGSANRESRSPSTSTTTSASICKPKLPN
jgi:integrase